MLDMAVKKYTIRLPDDLHGTLAQLAKKDLRSLHSEILALLREAADARLRKMEREKRPGSETPPA